VDNLYVVDTSFFPSSAGLNPSLTVAAKHVAGGRADIYSLAKHNRQSIRLRRDMIHIGECPRTVTNAVCSVGGVLVSGALTTPPKNAEFLIGV
jgi:GMC oxidoreductase